MNPICTVAHPKYGFGRVESVVGATDGPLAFVRWTEPRTGVAGGWYDLADPQFTIEGAVALIAAFDLVSR